MLVAALLGHDRVPGDACLFLLDGRTIDAHEFRTVRLEDNDLAIFHEDHIFGVHQDRRDVGGDEVLALSYADDKRRALPGRDQGLRIVGRHRDQGVDTI